MNSMSRSDLLWSHSMSIHKLSGNMWFGPTRIFWCYCLWSSLIYIHLLFRLFENAESTLKIICLISLLTSILLRNERLLRNQDFQLHQDLLQQICCYQQCAGRLTVFSHRSWHWFLETATAFSVALTSPWPSYLSSVKASIFWCWPFCRK